MVISPANLNYFAVFGGMVWGAGGFGIFFLIIQGYSIAWYNDKSRWLKQFLKILISSVFLVLILFFRQR